MSSVANSLWSPVVPSRIPGRAAWRRRAAPDPAKRIPSWSIFGRISSCSRAWRRPESLVMFEAVAFEAFEGVSWIGRASIFFSSTGDTGEEVEDIVSSTIIQCITYVDDVYCSRRREVTLILNPQDSKKKKPSPAKVRPKAKFPAKLIRQSIILGPCE